MPAVIAVPARERAGAPSRFDQPAVEDAKVLAKRYLTSD
jgi:hypothetical protein